MGRGGRLAGGAPSDSGTPRPRPGRYIGPVYRTLQPEKIVETAQSLATRVKERFPESGLWKVAAEVAEVARKAQERCAEIRRPHLPLRILIAGLVALAVGIVAFLLGNLEATREMWRVENFFSELDNLLGSAVFLGAAILFLVTLEGRWKRRKALDAVGELRALAHVVDMHQLTKDPEPLLRRGPTTASSPKRSMTAFELSRYFDYCSELVSVITKVGALYVQVFPDPVALDAVDDLEDLCLGLSHKMRQKASLVERYGGPAQGGRGGGAEGS